MKNVHLSFANIVSIKEVEHAGTFEMVYGAYVDSNGRHLQQVQLDTYYDFPIAGTTVKTNKAFLITA